MIYKIYGKNRNRWELIDRSTDKEEAILKGKSLEGYEQYMVAKEPLDYDIPIIGEPQQKCKVVKKDFKSKYKVEVREFKVSKAKKKQDLQKLITKVIKQEGKSLMSQT